jgi:aspartate dehydrogenase
MTQKKTRIGFIGYGQIGKAVHKMIDENPAAGLEVVFVHDQVPGALDSAPPSLVLRDLADFESRKPDLVVEMAHPDVTRKWAVPILQKTNYMLVSVTALADPGMEEKLLEVTRRCGTRAFIPHGGAVGLSAMRENRDVWQEVCVTMKKSPKNVDCRGAGVDPDKIVVETVLYDGPARGVCPKFPRNTNTIAALAYAGIGFERTRAVLIVNPAWTTAIVSLSAKGPGVDLRIEREESISGVTGASTPASIFNSMRNIGSTDPGIHLR